MNNNKRKDELLGEPHGTANGKLRKAIIFDLAGRCGMLGCHRCGKPIETINALSIEHKDHWQQATDPRASFFDLENIAFSHLKCNIASNSGGRTEGAARGRLAQSVRTAAARVHGSGAMYWHGCRCEACRKTHSDANRAARRRP